MIEIIFYLVVVLTAVACCWLVYGLVATEIKRWRRRRAESRAIRANLHGESPVKALELVRDDTKRRLEDSGKHAA
jgi:peptidoglycan/LPS O-acetylase OafA/YrhL